MFLVDASISSLNSRADVLENKLISFNVLMGQTATITESSTFTQMLFFQGNSASAYGAYILTGYGPGTTSRYHVASIFDNDAITVSISDNAFIIANNSGSDLYGRLLLINGPSPTIS